MVVHIDSESIPERENVAVGRQLELNRELYEFGFSQGAQGSRVCRSSD